MRTKTQRAILLSVYTMEELVHSLSISKVDYDKVAQVYRCLRYDVDKLRVIEHVNRLSVPNLDNRWIGMVEMLSSDLGKVKAMDIFGQAELFPIQPTGEYEINIMTDMLGNMDTDEYKFLVMEIYFTNVHFEIFTVEIMNIANKFYGECYKTEVILLLIKGIIDIDQLSLAIHVISDEHLQNRIREEILRMNYIMENETESKNNRPDEYYEEEPYEEGPFEEEGTFEEGSLEEEGTFEEGSLEDDYDSFEGVPSIKNQITENDVKIEDLFYKNEDIEKIPESDLCALCLARRKAAIFLYCGHLSVCVRCAFESGKRSGKCPFCKQEFNCIIKTFDAL